MLDTKCVDAHQLSTLFCRQRDLVDSRSLWAQDRPGKDISIQRLMLVLKLTVLAP